MTIPSLSPGCATPELPDSPPPVPQLQAPPAISPRRREEAQGAPATATETSVLSVAALQANEWARAAS